MSPLQHSVCHKRKNGDFGRHECQFDQNPGHVKAMPDNSDHPNSNNLPDESPLFP